MSALFPPHASRYRCKYHLKLIPKRWFKEELQDSIDLEESMGPFLRTKTQKAYVGSEDVNVNPTATYMVDIQKMFPLAPSLSRDDQSRLSKKRRYGEISGLMKDIITVVDSNPEVFEMVKESLDQVIVKGRGVEGMKDPAHVKTKGRPKTSRIRSVTEVKKHSTKCGVCNEGGRNARKHRSQYDP